MSDDDRLSAVWLTAEEFCRAKEEKGVAAALARAAAPLGGAEAVRVWVLDRNEGWRLAGVWPETGPIKDRPPADVAKAAALGVARVSAARPPFRSRLVAPLLIGSRPMGAVELLEAGRPEGPLSATDAACLDPLLRVAAAAIEASRAVNARERAHLETITRMALLYDVSRSLSARLEMDALHSLVANRALNALGAEGVYLWILSVDAERLSVAAAAGPAVVAVADWELPVGEGIAGRAVSAGAALLLDDADELADMADRPDVQAGLELRSVVAAPVTSGDGAVLGVIEAVNREDGDVFDAKQIPLLAEIAEVAGLAIANARNVEAERRASDLGALLETAQELSAHLDPQKVTFTLVHKAATVLQYRTASVGLFRGSRFDLAAVSGQTVVDESLPEMRALRDLLEWAAGLDHGLYVVQEEDGTIDTDRPETREKFRAYFEVSGTRSFVSVPLADDEGRLGVFALEAAEPYVYSERDIEAASLLGVQATVAIRNATLYRQIPMMHVMRPLAEHRDRLIRLPWARRAAGIGAVVLAAAVLAIPVPLRIGGDARVLPVRKLPSTAEVEGRLIRVLVREGDRVEAGQVLAEMDDADYRGGLGDARARYETVLREQRLRRSEGDTGAAAVEAARLEGLRAEVALWEDRIAKTAIRAATGGLVATPRVDERVGERLARGDVFCEVVDPASQAVELSVYEQDAGIVRAGMPVKIKLNAYPTRSLRGEVERIGVAAAPAESGPAVLLRVRLAAGAPALVTGMTGRAKVSTGLVPLGRVVFRRPARWIWSWLWGWLP